MWKQLVGNQHTSHLKFHRKAYLFRSCSRSTYYSMQLRSNSLFQLHLHQRSQRRLGNPTIQTHKQNLNLIENADETITRENSGPWNREPVCIEVQLFHDIYIFLQHEWKSLDLACVLNGRNLIEIRCNQEWTFNAIRTPQFKICRYESYTSYNNVIVMFSNSMLDVHIFGAFSSFLAMQWSKMLKLKSKWKLNQGDFLSSKKG